MSITENLDQLQQSLLILSREGSIKERLADAFSLHLSQLDIEQLPAELRLEFIALRTTMTRERPLPKESVARASARKLSTDEANRLAALVVRLFAEQARMAPRSRRTRGPSRRPRMLAVSAERAPIVKLFATEAQ